MYEARSDSRNSTTSATSPKEVTGLESGKNYTFTVTANYSGYNGPTSASASAVRLCGSTYRR